MRRSTTSSSQHPPSSESKSNRTDVHRRRCSETTGVERSDHEYPPVVFTRFRLVAPRLSRVAHSRRWMILIKGVGTLSSEDLTTTKRNYTIHTSDDGWMDGWMDSPQTTPGLTEIPIANSLELVPVEGGVRGGAAVRRRTHSKTLER